MTTVGASVPGKEARTGRVALSRVLVVTAVAWLVPVLATVTTAGDSIVLSTTTAAALLGVTFILLAPANVIVVLPFFTLLSPMTGLLDLGGAKLVYSDLLFLILAVQVAFLVGRFKVRPGVLFNQNSYIFLGLYILSLFIGLATGTLISMKPLLYLFQLFIVAFYAAAYASAVEGRKALMMAWVVATLYAALILLQAYASGQNLDMLKTPNAVQTQATGPVDLISLFRATYYYSGIHYILGIVVVWLAVKLLFPAPALRRTAIVGALFLVALALVVMVNKTAILAGLIAIGVTAFLLLFRFNRNFWKVTGRILVIGGGCALLLLWQLDALAEKNQLDLISGRLTSASSLSIRLEVFTSAVREWLASPFRWLTGFGPDFLDSSGDPALAILFKKSAVTGYVEGTVDSAWLSFLIELGIPSILLMGVLFMRGFVRAVNTILTAERMDDVVSINASLLAAIVFLAIAMSTQMLGYSKLTWLPLQVLVLAAAAPMRRRPLSRP